MDTFRNETLNKELSLETGKLKFLARYKVR